MTLPKPNIHFETLKLDPQNNPLNWLSESNQTALLDDPLGEKGTNPFPMTSSGADQIFAFISYKRAGEQVVVLGPRMQRAFENTSLKNVSAQHARLPFKCFYLATPESKLKVGVLRKASEHTLVGAYVMESLRRSNEIDIFIWGGVTNEFYHMPISLSDGLVDIEQQIEGPNQILGLRAIIRVAVNTVLFMNSTSCEKVVTDNPQKRRELKSSLAKKPNKHGSKAKEIQDQLDKLPTYRTTWIGPTIEQAANADTDMESTRTVRSHIRRGHWHTVLSGPRKDQDGNSIDSTLRQASLKWFPPIWVEGEPVEDDQKHIYRIREPVGEPPRADD